MGWGDIDVGDVEANPLVGIILDVEDDFIDNVDEIFKSGSDFRVCIPAFQHDVIPEDRTHLSVLQSQMNTDKDQSISNKPW